MTLFDHRPGFAIAAMGLAAVLLAAPALASADHGDRRSRAEEGRRDEGVRENDRHRGHREYTRHAHHRHHHYGAPFFCKPCLQRFASRDRFQRHLRRHHHVPPWRLPRVIGRRAPGWVFFGGGR